MAVMVPTRLWLAGLSAAIGTKPDPKFWPTKSGVALCSPRLVAVDGWSVYVRAFERAFRSPVPRWSQPGRCQLRPWSEVAIVQVVKQRLKGQ